MYSVTRQGWLGVPFRHWWSYDVILFSNSFSFFVHVQRLGQHLYEVGLASHSPRFSSFCIGVKVYYPGPLSSKANLNGTEEEIPFSPLSQRCLCSGQCHRTLLWPMRQGLLCAYNFWEHFCFFFQVSFTISACLPCLWCLGLLRNSLWMKLTAKWCRGDASKSPGTYVTIYSLNQPLLKPALVWVSCSRQ